MPTSAIPLVLGGLLTVGNTIASVSCTYGPNFSGYDGDVLMIGVDDPDSTDPKSAASEAQTWSGTGAGRPRDAEGTVSCAIAAETGDGSPTGLQDAVTRAFAILGSFESAIRTDFTLGNVATLLWAELENVELSWNQTDGGAYALIIFTIRYLARI